MEMMPIEREGDLATTVGEPRQRVHSPEQVVLELPVAGPTTRMLAYAVDALIILLLDACMMIALLLTTSLASWLVRRFEILGAAAKAGRDPFSDGSAFLLIIALLLVMQLVAEWGYFTFFETVMGGRSPGKAAMGLRVVRDGGLSVGLRESLIRNLLRAVDILPSSYLTGLVAMLVSPEGKRLGDMAAGTVVVRLDRPPAPAPLAAGPPGEELARFRFRRDQIARLGRPERALLRETLRRLDRMEPSQAAAALERAAEALRARIGYEAVEPDARRAFLYALERALARR
jgi:uncharacterized RDD family membrane protein YckC